MIFILGLLFLGLLVLSAIALAVFRSWTLDEGRTESWLRSPDTHKLTYVVPEGIDAAQPMAALAHAGFTCVVAAEHGNEELLIACEDADRAEVAEVIEHARRPVTR
jgi:hypothetical protein